MPFLKNDHQNAVKLLNSFMGDRHVLMFAAYGQCGDNGRKGHKLQWRKSLWVNCAQTHVPNISPWHPHASNSTGFTAAPPCQTQLNGRSEKTNPRGCIRTYVQIDVPHVRPQRKRERERSWASRKNKQEKKEEKSQGVAVVPKSLHHAGPAQNDFYSHW